jgi:acyl carrier protein
MTDEIRGVLQEYGRLSVDTDSLEDTSNLYDVGMTSHASVNVMLALENTFDVEFPDRMLRRNVFESITAIRSALEELKDDE